MRDVLERSLFTVRRDGATWAVEHEGDLFGHSREKEIAEAHARKRARQVIDGGGAAKVLVQGERGLR